MARGLQKSSCRSPKAGTSGDRWREIVMKYPRYSAFVSALLVSPLFLAVGCAEGVEEGDECTIEIEGAKLCSVARDKILICTEGVWISHMECADGTVCEIGGESPECVPEGGTGGSSGSGGTAGSAGTGGSGGTDCISDDSDTPCDPLELNFDCCGYPDSICETATMRCTKL
jgi:hypothetical protein